MFWSDCVLTACYLINRLPSSILNGKSPFSLVYGREPNLSHLRSFGCLCFAVILKGSDKFSEKAEKCVLIGYASGKKAYKLLSLENRSVLYSRDVKFYETVFPFKMSQKQIVESTDEVSNLNFFDLVDSESKNTTKTSTPYDDNDQVNKSQTNENSSNIGRDGSMHQPVGNNNLDQHSEQIPQTLAELVVDYPVNDEQHTATPIDDQIDQSEGNVAPQQEVPVFQNLPEESNQSRPKRVSRLPLKLNEYVLDGKVRYGLHRYANHAVLTVENCAFVSNLNKTSEPTSYEEASKRVEWKNSIND